MGKDFYNILGLNKNASSDEIKKAYKKLALKYHPDKNKTPEAVEMFQLINQANEILSNPEKKETYDNFGEAGLEQMNMPNPFSFNMNPFAGMRRHNYVEELIHTVTLVEVFTQTQTSIKI